MFHQQHRHRRRFVIPLICFFLPKTFYEPLASTVSGFSTRRILLSSCILHQDYLKLFASGDVQSQSFYFVEWMDGEKNTQTTATHEWRRGRDSEQTWMLLVSWRVLRVACANGIKRLTKRNNHNVCPFEPKMCAPTTRNFHSFLCPLNFHFFFLSLRLRSLSTS